MNHKLSITLLLAAFFQPLLHGQSETYIVKKAVFSTDKYDEFSPVCYKGGIVFCSNLVSASIKNYTTNDNKGFFKIVYTDTLAGSSPGHSYLSKKLNTKFNDGPVTFNGRGDTIFYSRNLLIDGKMSEVSSVRNKLGIFYAVFDGSDWTKIREFRVNSEWYNVTTPCLSPDGKRLYFASDKPGGYGGSDIYYCQWRNDYWEDPVNLGPVINTSGNESYPFVNAAGEFFFASDGHHGLGGKDIYFSRYADTSWSAPVLLDPPVNSAADDFGIYTDTLMEKGFFSSNRDKSIDVFEFRTGFPQIFYSSEQKESSYCFSFNDTGTVFIDTLNLQYRWSFGDGKTSTGTFVNHCYASPGKYQMVLDIIERSSGRKYFTQRIDDIEIKDFEQAYINAPETGVTGEEIMFDGLKSYLPGYRIIGYSWDFGDKNRAKGQNVTHAYKAGGEYQVNLELALRSDSSGQVSKTGVSKVIRIFGSRQQAEEWLGRQITARKTYTDFRHSANAVLDTKYSAENEYRKDAVFSIEIIRSRTKLDLKGSEFRNIPSVYTLKERFEQPEGVYSYTVEQYINLMSAYPAFTKLTSLGFKDARVKMIVLTDPAEKELLNLKRINGTYADTYFDYSDRLTSNAFIMLDQVVRLLNKYPTLRLELAVHTDNTASADKNLSVSQKRAQALVEYITTRGINTRRLVPVGYGASKPVASNMQEKDRRLNRRIDISIISK